MTEVKTKGQNVNLNILNGDRIEEFPEWAVGIILNLGKFCNVDLDGELGVAETEGVLLSYSISIYPAGGEHICGAEIDIEGLKHLMDDGSPDGFTGTRYNPPPSLPSMVCGLGWTGDVDGETVGFTVMIYSRLPSKADRFSSSAKKVWS